MAVKVQERTLKIFAQERGARGAAPDSPLLFTALAAALFAVLLASLFAVLFLSPATALCAGEDEAVLGIGGEWSFTDERTPPYVSRNWSFDDIPANISGSEIRGRSEIISFYGIIQGDNLVIDVSLNSSGGDAYVYWEAKGVVMPIPGDGGRTYSDVVPIDISYADKETGEGGLYSGTLQLEASLRGSLVPGEEAEEDEDEGTAVPGTTEGGTTDTGTPQETLPEGDRETWWGAVVTILAGFTALIAGAGPYLIGILTRASSAAASIPAQGGLPAAAASATPQLDAVLADQGYQPLGDGAVLSRGVTGQGDDVFQGLHNRLTKIKGSIPFERAAALDRIWGDYISGDIGEDKVRLIAGLLENEQVPLDRINESYDLILKWERSRADKAGMVIKDTVKDMIMDKLDPLGFAQDKIVDEAERVGNLFKDAGLLRIVKAFGVYSHITDIADYVNLAIKANEVAGYLTEPSDYPHFNEYVKQLGVTAEEVPVRLASTRRQIEEYSRKLADKLQEQKETTLGMTEGDTPEGVRINRELREKLERIDGMIDSYKDVLDDLRLEERVYMVRGGKAEAPVIKAVKPGDRFIRPDIGGTEIH